MGNSQSTPSTPPNAPSSPIILLSLHIAGPIKISTTGQIVSTTQLAITLTNSTAHPITFRHILTPLDVSRCFSDTAFSHLWAIDDITEYPVLSRPHTAESDRVAEILIVTERTYHQPLLTAPQMRRIKAKDPKVEDFITLMPGAKKALKMSFDMNVSRGLEIGKKYAFKIREGGFDVPDEGWGYGKKKAVVKSVQERVQRMLTTREGNEGWGVESTGNASTEAVDGSRDGTEGRGVLRFRCVEGGGAVLEVQREDELRYETIQRNRQLWLGNDDDDDE